ncbi:MAG: hypothetical protein HKO10_10395 [Acidimicrobiia bacterium]|nr:hypothetical protein [Acidimicrobiia bacterium]
MSDEENMNTDHPPFPDPDSPERIEMLFDLAAGVYDDATFERLTAGLTDSERHEIEEQRVVHTLLAEAPPIAMDDLERAALRDAIRSAGPGRGGLLGFRMPWGLAGISNRIALGSAAASLLIVVVAGSFVMGGGLGGSDSADLTADAAASTTMQAPGAEESADADFFGSDENRLSAPETAAVESLQSIEEPADGSGVAAVEDVSVIRESDVEELLAETPSGPRPYNPDNLACRDELPSNDVTFGYLGQWRSNGDDQRNAVMFKIERGLDASVRVLDTADCSLLFELDK